MKKFVFTILAITLSCLTGCIFFQDINQPTKSLPNDIVTVSIHATTDGTDPSGIYSPYFGICLPVGWIVPGDSIKCSGVYNKVIYYNDSLSAAQNSVSPAPTGYYWWVGTGEAVGTVKGNVYSVLSIQTDNQIGTFSIDYMLGDSGNGVNQQRSDGHQIEIIDNEYSPRRLQTAVQGNSVKLNWSPPDNTSGLSGYNIYRDEEKINSNIIADTLYSDSNPIGGIHHYKISSYYNNGNESLMPYDKSVVYQSIYISPNGSNANNGSSFTDALQTINYAMSVIRSDSSHPITVFIEPGYYSPFTNEEQFPITCLSYTSFIGGGKEATILDADGESYVLQFIEGNNYSISGLAIWNGGDGIYINKSDISLADVAIKENNNGISCINSAVELVNSEITHNGGGINSSISDIDLVNVNVTNNTGGAININNSNLELFYGNILENSGGGISCSDSSNVNLTSINISHNNANNGGGINCSDRSNVNLTNSNISYNNANSGGGIYCSDSSNVNLTNSNISYNNANNGGGISCSDLSNMNLNSSIISYNTADNNGGGIYCIDSSIIGLANVNIIENVATESGGGIYCQNNSVLNFDPYNRSHVYLNQSCVGFDLYSSSFQNIVVQTFTVHYPTDLFAHPINNFSFTIHHGIINQTEEELFVSPQGDNNNSGLSPAEPLKTIRYALMKIIADSSHPNKINLLDGIYSHSGNEEFFPIIIPSYVSVKGTSDSSVIIDAEGYSKAIYIPDDTEITISDLTVRGSHEVGIYCESSYTNFERLKIVNNEGDGFYCNNSSPEIQYITIEENGGSGIKISDGSSPALENVIVSNNGTVGISCNESSHPTIDSVTVSGNNGNGIECKNGSNPILTNVNILENKGGGLYCLNNSNPSLDNVTISGNNGGGISCNDHSSPNLKKVLISDNSSENDGGGIYCASYSSPILDSVIIKNNFTSHSGGGISCEDYSNIKLNNVIITSNSSSFAGGIYCIDSSNVELVNVYIVENSAIVAGGIRSVYSNPVLQNVVITNNQASRYGGGLHFYGSSPLLSNVTISGNSSNYYGGIFCQTNSNPTIKNCIVWNNADAEICVYLNSTITISYSDVRGGEAGIIIKNNAELYWLDGNKDEDPLFVGTGGYPFTLLSGSPCIDSGDPDTVFNDPEDPNNLGFAIWPAMGTIRNDMGAYGGPGAESWNVTVTGIEDEKTKELEIPTEFELAQNYPNPFNPSTTIQYSIKERSRIELILYDILGAQVKVLVNEEQDAGYYKVNFNAGSLASGIYFYRLQAGDFIQTKKMILLK